MQEWSIEVPIKVTAQDIDDIICTALEGGITYWCDEADITKFPDPATYTRITDKPFNDKDRTTWEWASDVISRGGELTLHDNEGSMTYVLTLDKTLAGIKLFLTCKNHNSSYNQGVIQHGGLDCASIDADCADMIVQYALFGEVVYS
jgi:hypothetical protein